MLSMKLTTILLQALFLSTSFSSGEAACSVCPGEGTVSQPDAVLPLPGRLLTCGGLEKELGSSAAVVRTTGQCRSLSPDVNFLDSIIDIASFCGCQDAPVPNTCSFCGEGVNVINDKILPGVENEMGKTNCGDIATTAPFVTSPEFCDTLRTNFATGCCDEPSRTACSICPDGSTVGAPDQRLSIVGGRTCEEIDSQVSFTSMDQCDAVRLALNVEEPCQCGRAVPDVDEFENEESGCQLCSTNGTWAKPGYSVGDFKIPGTEGLTCGSIAELARKMNESTVCQEELQPFARGCCSDYKNDRCSICPAGGSPGLPNHPLVIDGEQMTCGELDFKLGFRAGTGDECQAAQDEYDALPFDITSWCGCPDVEIPNECSLCGPTLEVANPNWKILGAAGTTCGYIDKLARHVVDKEYCDSEVALIATQCCMRRPFEVTPSLAPTVTPSAEDGTSGVVHSSSTMIVALGLTLLVSVSVGECLF